MLMMFCLHVFYVPTLKQVVIQYKLWNQVMIWFTEIMCYNVYIPLLIRQANDVEKILQKILALRYENSLCSLHSGN